MPWVDKNGRSHAFFWENPETMEKYHHVQQSKEQNKKDFERYCNVHELRICKSFWLDKTASAEFFKGSFFDYWRFWKTTSECVTCQRLFKPTRTAESYLVKKKAIKYTNYNY